MATGVVPNNMPNLTGHLIPPSELAPVIDQLWRLYADLIIDGRTHEICIPFPVRNAIGQKGLDVIKTRFQYMIARAVDVYENTILGFVGMRVAPDRGPDHLLTHNAPELKVKKKAAVKNAKVPRPPNAFILYRQHHHPLVKAQYPDMHNNQISIILGTQWRNETQSNKQHWNTIAEQIKTKHLQDNPAYSYQPRKPSEKKRRMTRGKAAVLAGTISTQVSSSSAATAVHSGATNFAPVSLTGIYYDQTALPTDGLLFPTPDLERTESGNAIVNIGDLDLSDAVLSEMLQKYNGDKPALVNQNSQRYTDHLPALIYTEDDAVLASEKDFFNSVINWDELIETEAEAARRTALEDEAWNNFMEEQTALQLENEQLEAEILSMRTLLANNVDNGEASAQNRSENDSIVANNIEQVTNMGDGSEQDG